MTYLTLRLNQYHSAYLEEIGNLPMYTKSGRRIIGLTVGRMLPNGCIHESLREAEKCYHDSDSWDNADEVLIIEEGLL